MQADAPIVGASVGARPMPMLEVITLWTEKISFANPRVAETSVCVWITQHRVKQDSSAAQLAERSVFCVVLDDSAPLSLATLARARDLGPSITKAAAGDCHAYSAGRW